MLPYDPSEYRLPAYQPREGRSDYRSSRSRSRSPPPHHYGDPRVRARAGSPYRRAELPPQPKATPNRPARQAGHRAKNPKGIFKGLKYYCFSDEFDPKAVRKFCSRMKDEGAKGVPEMYMAEVIVVLVSESKTLKSVEWSGDAPPRGPEDSLTVEGVYHSFATRLYPDKDLRRLDRKCVVQSDWVELCLEQQKNRQPGAILREDWEVKMDNREQPLEVFRTNAMNNNRPDTPPLPDVLLPDMSTQVLPSLEYQQSEPVRSATPEVPKTRLPANRPEPVPPVVVSAPHEVSTARRIALQQGWTDSMISVSIPKLPAPAVNLIASASISPGPPSVRVSVDPRLQSPAYGTSRSTAAPSLRLTPIPMTTQQNAEPTSEPSPSPPLTSGSTSSNTAEADQELPEAAPTTPTVRSKSARTGVNGVFARGQVMPWLFHVYGDDRTGMAAMMIEDLGGGQIAPLHLASTIVIPASGVREAQTDEIQGIVKSVGFGREVVSIDWVSQCIKDDGLVDYEPYRITLSPIQTATETRMDVEMAVEEAPLPVPAPPVELELEAAPAPVSPLIQAELLQVSRSEAASNRVRHISKRVRSRNATAGPSGPRHSTGSS